MDPRKLVLVGLPVSLIALTLVYVFLRPAVPAPWRHPPDPRIVFVYGGYLYIMVIGVALWLAVPLDAVRGVGLGVAMGLLSLATTLLIMLAALPNYDRNAIFWVSANPAVPATYVAIAGGLLGGLVDRRRGTSGRWRGSVAVRLAVVGAVVGFALGYVLLFYIHVAI